MFRRKLTALSFPSEDAVDLTGESFVPPPPSIATFERFFLKTDQSLPSLRISQTKRAYDSRFRLICRYPTLRSDKNLFRIEL